MLFHNIVAQFIEHRATMLEVVSSTPAGPTLTEEKVLPL